VPTPSGAGDQLDGVSCLTSHFCMAVGGGLIEQWNGTSWSMIGSPVSGANLLAISCESSALCMAVGSQNNQTLAEQWDGTGWSQLPTPSEGSQASFSGVSCPTATFCVAVGGAYGAPNGSPETYIADWTGASWNAVPSPDPGTSEGYPCAQRHACEDALYGVSCFSANACLAVGGPYQAIAESWDGSSWSVQPAPNPVNGDELSGVACTGPSSCLVVGNQTPRSTEQTLAESCVGGHEILLVGGHESPGWRPREFPMGGHQISLSPVR